jgi:hypothetical protein
LPRSGWRTRCWTPGDEDRVLLSERYPELNRLYRTALPFSGPVRQDRPEFLNRARRNHEDHGQTVAVPVEAPPQGVRSSLPDEQHIDPLYLFACSLSWRGQSNTSAGWEMVRSLRSPGQNARIAAALLTHPGNIEPPVRVRAIETPTKTLMPGKEGLPSSARRWL